MWDERYSDDEYAYGKKPNDFLAGVVDQLPAGRVLSLGEGEGRNAVFLAEKGFDVVAVDSSSVGLKKAEKLAQERKVSIEIHLEDLSRYEIMANSWDVIVSIFCHVAPSIRKRIHKQVVDGLRPGGMLVLEAYRPEQLQYKTGGPPSAEPMMTLDILKQELAGLEIIHGVELDRDVVEGKYHTGKGAVVQVLARKP